jgi:tRNA dimethylallyltransferase
MEKKKIIVVVGPTASGKSDFAVQLALKENGEIISADSRQLYRGLDIGTGKITETEMKGVKHYMLSVYNLNEEVSVARYARDTLPILEDILTRGKTPIICGGSGQYIDALIFDTKLPKVPSNKQLREELEKLPTEELIARLQASDPVRAEKIDSRNRVRLIRSLEIVESLGRVPSQDEPHLLYDTKIYLMNPSRERLRQRIEKRLVARLDIGMLNECKKLVSEGITHESLERLGLEYRYMSRHLQGELSYYEMVKQLTHKINQYAKRQQTWNKKYSRNYPSLVTNVSVE